MYVLVGLLRAIRHNRMEDGEMETSYEENIVAPLLTRKSSRAQTRSDTSVLIALNAHYLLDPYWLI